MGQVQVSVVNHKEFLGVITELLMDSQSVLDVGCGVGTTLKDFPCPIKIGIDPHKPYLEKAKQVASFLPIKLEAEHLEDTFIDKSIDSVTLIDVIEHMEKETGFEVLRQAERIASKKVIVFTPRGFFKQLDTDHLDLGGEFYQKHRSGWEVEDFLESGYQVIIFENFHDQENLAFLKVYGQQADPIDALLAWKNIDS